MELTIEEALKQGIAAHKEGKLQEAERLYRAILQSVPLHPDANHNLGVIALSVNNSGAALPLFRNALEANPKIEQFWLSYIDVLIREKQFEKARQVIRLGEKQGLKTETLKGLDEKLAFFNQTNTVEQKSAPQEKLSKLSEYYQNRQFGEAENLAISITKEFPENQFSWKVLGAVLGQVGRQSEAVNANQTAIALSPEDAEAHGNLGITLQALGRLKEAKASYTRAIALEPDYAEAHNNLGNTLKQLGSLAEAKSSFSRAIALEPDYAESHNNLGITLKELGRLAEAKSSFSQAITLRPDYAEARYNLGSTLKELGGLAEAEASYLKAIALKPDFAEAHSSLGNILQELGRLEEAEASYMRAIALKPDYAEALSNLGVTLKELGRLAEAEASYLKAIALKPNFAEAMFNLSLTLSYMNDIDAEIVSLQNILQIDSGDYGLRASVSLAICNFLRGDFSDSKKRLLASAEIQEKESIEFENEKIYRRYLLDILSWHDQKSAYSQKRKPDKILYVIGESHSLVSHQLQVQISGFYLTCRAKLIKGCKQWHIGNPLKNQYKNQFESIFSSLPKSSRVLLAIGEIDCRLDSGIIKHKKKFPQKEIGEIVASTVENYLNYILKNNLVYQHKIIIQGVPCPNIDVSNQPKKEVRQLVEMINRFNCEVKTKSEERGFGFLDVHKLTDRGDGFSNALWHMDEIHLSPEGFLEAWARYTSGLKHE